MNFTPYVIEWADRVGNAACPPFPVSRSCPLEDALVLHARGCVPLQLSKAKGLAPSISRWLADDRHRLPVTDDEKEDASATRPEDRCCCLRPGEGPGLCGWLAHHERGDRPGPCPCRCHKSTQPVFGRAAEAER